MDTGTCEWCNQPLADDTQTSVFGLVACADFDACLARQAAQGDGYAADLLRARNKRKEAQRKE